jgi:hypothetical protein
MPGGRFVRECSCEFLQSHALLSFLQGSAQIYEQQSCYFRALQPRIVYGLIQEVVFGSRDHHRAGYGIAGFVEKSFSLLRLGDISYAPV